MANKKIINATGTNSCGIEFKSRLEKSIYTYLKKEGIDIQYEPRQITLWDGFKPITPFYDKEGDKQHKKSVTEKRKSHKLLVLKKKSIVGIRYTPDFYFKHKDFDVWIEAKGFENDVFYIKKKLFIKYLDNLQEKTGQKSIYFEVYSLMHLKQALEILKQYE